VKKQERSSTAGKAAKGDYAAQYAALRAVNKELIALHRDIGRAIVERQQGKTWGKSVVEQLRLDA
jgi:N-methylhydantoinase B/oxoprolinase/acetone carboxylase alpha subunit